MILATVAALVIGRAIVAGGQDDGAPLELTDEQLGLVFRDRFERIENERFTYPWTVAGAAEFRGLLSKPAVTLTTPAGRGLSLAGRARIAYRGPAMINLAEGTLILRLALDFVPGELGANVDLLSLSMSGGG